MYYDYKDEMKADIKRYVDGNTYESREELEDELWIADDVTGNGSGSYWMNREKAREALHGDSNADQYAKDLIREYGLDAKTIVDHLDDPEYWDVSIRCWLLGDVLAGMSDEELHIVA